MHPKSLNQNHCKDQKKERSIAAVTAKRTQFIQPKCCRPRVHTKLSCKDQKKEKYVAALAAKENTVYATKMLQTNSGTETQNQLKKQKNRKTSIEKCGVC